MTASLPAQDRGALAFGEKLLTLLEIGSFTATYKYAVLLALVDLCLEHSSRSGAAPDVLTTRQLADKVLEVYWPHTVPFACGGEERILRQSTSGQAEIVSLIQRFREREVRNPLATFAESRAAAPEGFRRLVDHIEWKLVEMPLPRLQMFGSRQRQRGRRVDAPECRHLLRIPVHGRKKLGEAEDRDHRTRETLAIPRHDRRRPVAAGRLMQNSVLEVREAQIERTSCVEDHVLSYVPWDRTARYLSYE